jgi:serine-type D-Ala-D-Ala carboxypeptidase
VSQPPSPSSGGGAESEAVTLPEIDRCIQTGIYEKTYSAAACIASVGGRIYHRAIYGQPSPPPPVRKADFRLLFDLGSLTRPLGSGLLALWLAGKGRLDLAIPIPKVVPELKDPRFGKVTLAMLLDHSAGFPADRPLWQELRALDDKRQPADRVMGTARAHAELKRLLSRVPLAYEPGTSALESELGFLSLGWALEAATGQPLDAYLERELFGPLGVADDLFYVRLADTRRRQGLERRQFATGEKCPWRNKLLQGEVSDPNAWAAGGVAGHAGLFGTVDAVWRVAHALWESYTGTGRFFLGGTVKRFWTRSKRFAATTRTLGWDTPTVNDSPAGKRFSQGSVGQVGSNGGAIWIDLSSDVIGIFLANANHAANQTASDAAAGHATAGGGRAALNKLHPRLFELIAKHGETLAPETKALGSRAFYSGPIQSGPSGRNALGGPKR